MAKDTTQSIRVYSPVWSSIGAENTFTTDNIIRTNFTNWMNVGILSCTIMTFVSHVDCSLLNKNECIYTPRSFILHKYLDELLVVDFITYSKIAILLIGAKWSCITILQIRNISRIFVLFLHHFVHTIIFT